MDVTETQNDGLKRELKVVFAANELEGKLVERLSELKSQARINGFRPGKVPVGHLRKLYGRSVMAEVVQQTVTDSTQQILEERSERPAYQPEIALSEDQEEMEGVMAGQKDLAYTVAFEVIPQIEIQEFSGFKLDKQVAEVADEHIDEALQEMAKQQRNFEPRSGAGKAKMGDQVTIDFVGMIDGEPFDGGSAEGAPLELGSNSFIPGFEEQLVGVKADDNKKVEVAFPDDYQVDELAGKPAVFDVTVKEVAAPADVVVDDEFATRMGLESLEKLREAIKEQITREFGMVSGAQLKRQLLDRLDEAYSFDLPEKLVEQEFEQIWRQVTQELEQNQRTFEDEDTNEDEAKVEYRTIAERRVRLGLLLGEVGEKHDISVSDDEVNQALMERVRQFPGQERQVYEFYQNNPQALLELRGPIFEQKVVDLITDQAEVSETKVSKEELYRDPDEDGDEASAKKAPKKKPAAKKAAAKKTATAKKTTKSKKADEPSAEAADDK